MTCIKNVLTGLDAQVHKVVVTELHDDTFFAVIWLERDGQHHQHRLPPVGRAGAGPARGLPDLRRRRGAEDLASMASAVSDRVSRKNSASGWRT